MSEKTYRGVLIGVAATGLVSCVTRASDTRSQSAGHYLIEQEGSRFPSLETAERCLANRKRLEI